jgi:hypothetical protein
MGLSCKGFEGELMALFTVIEVGWYQRELASISKSINKGERIKKIGFLY